MPLDDEQLDDLSSTVVLAVDADGVVEALPADVAPALLDDLRLADELASYTRARATQRAYDADVRALQTYLRKRRMADKPPIAPELVCTFLAYEAAPVPVDPDADPDDPGNQRPRRSLATIARRLAAIGAWHRGLGLEDPTKHPTVREVLTGIRRRWAGRDTAKPQPKLALELEALDVMLASEPLQPTTHAARRDRALLLVGLAGALRRSELVALDVDDVRWHPEGMLLSIGKSKTDQHGAGTTLAIAYGDRPDLCAVRALRDWLSQAGIHAGPVFRRIRRGDHVTGDRLTDRSVALIVKKHAAAVPFDRDEDRRRFVAALSGHSLRRGGITAAAREGYTENELQRLSRHRDLAILRGYVEQASEFDGAAQVFRER